MYMSCVSSDTSLWRDTVGIQWGYSEDTVRIQWGYSEDTVRIQWGYSEDTVRIQWGYSWDTECYAFYYRLRYLSSE